MSSVQYDLALTNSFHNCFRAIDEAITRLKARHTTHISVYGRDNERRLTGRHETANVSFNQGDVSLLVFALYSD